MHVYLCVCLCMTFVLHVRVCLYVRLCVDNCVFVALYLGVKLRVCVCRSMCMCECTRAYMLSV